MKSVDIVTLFNPTNIQLLLQKFVGLLITERVYKLRGAGYNRDKKVDKYNHHCLFPPRKLESKRNLVELLRTTEIWIEKKSKMKILNKDLKLLSSTKELK